MNTRIIWVATAVIVMTAAAAAAGAQTPTTLRTIKRTLLRPVLRAACPAAPTAPAAPTDDERRQARELAARSQQAAILGDTSAALSGLRKAAALDATDPDLAYQLARAYESGGSAANAVTQYCRFIALAPNSNDAPDARGRVAALANPGTDPVVDSANALFQKGLADYDRGRMVDADARFGSALGVQPQWADAYFDRAMTRLAQGDRERAANDFELYLRVKPTADDRDAVQTAIDGLRRPTLSATQAFGLGVLLPGAGQFYTHRPGLGVLSVVAAGSALGLGLMPHQSISTIQNTAVDPFGNTYTFPVTQKKIDHPYLVPGLAAAGGIALVGAIEAAMYAKREAAPRARVSFNVTPLRDGVAASVSIR